MPVKLVIMEILLDVLQIVSLMQDMDVRQQSVLLQYVQKLVVMEWLMDHKLVIMENWQDVYLDAQ